MNKYQAIFYELLCELDEICTKNNIHYLLDKKTAIQAYYQGEIDVDDPHVYISMRVSDCVKFAELVSQQNIQHRVVESWLNNPNFYGMHMRYCNTNTMFYAVKTASNMKYPCLGVDIIPVASFPEKKIYQRIFRVIKEGWCVGKDDWSNTTPRRLVAYFTTRALRIFLGKTRISKMAFLLEGKSERRLYYQFFENAMPNFVSCVKWYGENERVVVGKRSFPIFANITNREPIQINRNAGSSITNDVYVIDTEHSYTAYQQVFAENRHKHNVRAYRQAARKANLDLSIKYYRSLLFVRKSRMLIDRADDRIKTEQEYVELKPLIMSLLIQERNDDLITVLTPYILKAVQYHSKKLPFCIDPELSSVVIIVLHRTGRANIAKRFERWFVSDVNYYRAVHKDKKIPKPEKLEPEGFTDEKDESLIENI